MDALGVFLAALSAVLRVLVFGLVGAFLARKGILDRAGRRMLGAALFNALLPSLLFSKIATSLSLENTAMLGNFALCAGFAVVVTGMGFAFGFSLRALLESRWASAPLVPSWFPFWGSSAKRRRQHNYGVLAEGEERVESSSDAEEAVVAVMQKKRTSGAGSGDNSDASDNDSQDGASDLSTLVKGVVPRNIRVGLVAATTFGNSGALPIALMSAIASAPQLRDDVDIAGGDNLSEEAIVARIEDHGIQYISVYVSMLSTLMWGLGFSWMQISAESMEKEQRAQQQSAALREGVDSISSVESISGADDGSSESDMSSADESRSAVALSADETIDDIPIEDTAHALPSRRPGQSAVSWTWVVIRLRWFHVTSSISRAYVRCVPERARFVISKVVTPPQIGILLGVLFGLVSPLGNLIFDVPAALSDTPHKAPLGFIGSALTQIGAATIPAAVFILGANIYEGPGDVKPPSRLIFGVAFVRLLLMPLAGVALVQLAVALGLINPGDSVLKFVLMLECASPSALNLVLMCQLIGQGEREMASIEFYQYSASILTLTLWAFVFLLLV